MNVHEYVGKLPSDPLAALSRCCIDFFSFHKAVVARTRGNWADAEPHTYYDFYQVARLLLKFQGVELDNKSRLSPPDIHSIFQEVQQHVSEWMADKAITSRYSDNPTSILFSKDEITSIQEKTNALRDEIVGAEFLEETFRRRLLLRLEKFQSEIHKTISDLDVWLAGVTDASDVMEAVGSKAKPIVDRMREIVELARGAVRRRIGVEETPKQIEDKSGNEDSTG